MSTANGHPGLSFAPSLNNGNGNGMRQGRGGNQGYAPPQPKQPVLTQQHPTPYQHYPPHQPPQNSFSQLYNAPNPSPVQHPVQNGSRPQQPQLPVPGSRPRSTNHRQMPPQANNTSLSYIPTTMPQHIQQMNQQAISQQAINHQQSVAQDNSMMPQATPPAHSQPSAQPQTQQAPPPPLPPPQQSHADGPVQSHEIQHDDAMTVESMGESGEDGGEGKNGEAGSPFVPRTPMGSMMSAPPEGGSFPTLDAVHKFVLDYCTSVGYAIVIGRSKKTVPGLKKVLFVCDRAGKPPKRVNPETRKRKTSSRKCDCQFGFFAIEQRTQWTVRYRPNADHLQHNHGPSESPMLHPAARKLDSKMVATVKELKEQGVSVPQTLEILQQGNPNVPLLPRDIYNARAAITRNPTKVDAALAEDRPAIYSKPRPTAEERLIADLRKEVAKLHEELTKKDEDHQKKLAELEEKVREKDSKIQKFEMFVDMCNERVMFQREKLNQLDDINPTGAT
ncbi:unnamed protein product [Discula destructiva]